MPARMIHTDMPFAIFGLEADRDYLMARMISFFGGGFHSRAGFMAQQACEKYMKALLVQSQSEFPLTHKLIEIAELCARIDPYFADTRTRTILETFDYFEQVGRYGAAANFDPLSIVTEEIRTAGVMQWHARYLQDLDEFIFNVRGMLDWESGGFADQIKAILDRDLSSLLLSTWRGRPPLKVVLTKNNRHFRR